MTAKIIFSDIDGTLINSQHQVTTTTRDAIRKQIIAGTLFVPVSARMPKAMMTACSSITNSCPLVAYNGALVLDEMGRPLNSQFMKTETAIKLCQIVDNLQDDTVWNVYSGYNWLSPKKATTSPFIEQEENVMGVKSLPVTLEQLKKLQGVHKILIIGQPAKLDNLKNTLAKRFSELDFVKSAPHLLEITVKNVSKAQGVKMMAEAFGISLENCWAFGDNYNDEAMLQLVGHPVLMGNAPTDLKDKFKVITADNDHDGIAKVLNKLNN